MNFSQFPIVLFLLPEWEKVQSPYFSISINEIAFNCAGNNLTEMTKIGKERKINNLPSSLLEQKLWMSQPSNILYL